MRRCSSALPVAADMSASERLAVQMMAVLLAGIASKDQAFTMVIPLSTKDEFSHRKYACCQ